MMFWFISSFSVFNVFNGSIFSFLATSVSSSAMLNDPLLSVSSFAIFNIFFLIPLVFGSFSGTLYSANICCGKHSFMNSFARL